MTIKVAVVGATGRMGKLALELIDAVQDLELHAAIDSKSNIADVIGADVIFEVTRLEASERIVDFAIEHRIPVLVGTSGWSAAKLEALDAKLASDSPAVAVVPNFSVGSMLASAFAAHAAKFFDSIEIIEAHHAGKIDSPSGTAVRTAELIAKSREGKTQPLIPGVGQEARGSVVAGIPIHSLRLHGVSAKQEVLLGGDDELLSVSHEVTSVRAYAKGILLGLRVVASANGLLIGLDQVMAAGESLV